MFFFIIIGFKWKGLECTTKTSIEYCEAIGAIETKIN